MKRVTKKVAILQGVDRGIDVEVDFIESRVRSILISLEKLIEHRRLINTCLSPEEINEARKEASQFIRGFGIEPRKDKKRKRAKKGRNRK